MKSARQPARLMHCLDAQFKLLNRLGFHDRAREVLDALRNEEVPLTRTNGMLRVIVNAALEYSDPREVRTRIGTKAAEVTVVGGGENRCN